MLIKSDTLYGASLDYAVAKSLLFFKVDYYPRVYQHQRGYVTIMSSKGCMAQRYEPSLDAGQAFTLVNEFKIGFHYNLNGPRSQRVIARSAVLPHNLVLQQNLLHVYAPDPLTAICRLYVMLACGDQVNVPEELVIGNADLPPNEYYQPEYNVRISNDQNL